MLLVARRNDDLHKLLDDYLRDVWAAKEKDGKSLDGILATIVTKVLKSG